MKDFSKYLIRHTATIKDALIALNNLAGENLTLFVVDNDDIMLGTLTDGDIRRWLIHNDSLNSSVSVVMNRKFNYLDTEEIDVKKVRELRNKGITLIPLLNEEKNIKHIFNLKQLKSILPLDAVLMAGGKGERLRPLTEKTPKPLLPIGEKPIIDYNIDSLIEYGISDINVTVNYLKEQLIDHFKDPKDGVRIKCVQEPYFLGTIGSVKFIDTFQNDTVLVMNSDLFTNIDYEDYYLHFKENDADISVAAVPYSVSIPYGIFEVNGRDILEIKEKPTYNYYANAGIYLIKRQLLDLIPDETFFNATDFMQLLISKEKNVIRYPLVGYWIDIGKHEDYRKAQDIVKHIKY